MMQKVVRYSLDDVALDHKAVAQALNRACRRGSTRYAVRGLAQIDDALYFVLLPAGDQLPDEQYVLAPVEDRSRSGFTAELTERWAAGFDLIGTLQLGDGFLALYARPETPTDEA